MHLLSHRVSEQQGEIGTPEHKWQQTFLLLWVCVKNRDKIVQ